MKHALAIAVAVCLAAAPAAADDPPAQPDIAQLQAAADRGDTDALFNLGQAYRLGFGVERSPRTANLLYLRAAMKGHAHAQQRLGLTLYNEPGMRAESLHWLEKAARAGLPQAQFIVGVAYLGGPDRPPNPALAHSYIAQAAKANVTGAPEALATLKRHSPTRAPSPTLARPAATAVPQQVRIQLGAFASAASARHAWAQAQKAAGPALARLTPTYDSDGALVRLRAGPLPSLAAARDLCRALAERRVACFPVA